MYSDDEIFAGLIQMVREGKLVPVCPSCHRVLTLKKLKWLDKREADKREKQKENER